jgi:hypothetical protein
MKSVINLVVILVLSACGTTPDTEAPTINTDNIAGYWSGEVVQKLDTGQELDPIDIKIVIIAGCTAGKVCGKLTEGDYCPGEIVLQKITGTTYSFLSETVSGTGHMCGSGDFRVIDLELRSDGTILFMYHNGATISGILQRK